MTCERYWREGVVLYEHGDSDPHLEGCADCQQAHAACLDMIGAMPSIGDDIVGDPMWKSKVLDVIDAREHKAKTWRWSWWLNGAFAGAFAIVAVWLLVGRKPDPDEIRFGITTESGSVTRRSAPVRQGDLPEVGTTRSASVNDTVKITVRPTEEVRVYRADKLILRCPTPNARCTSDERSTMAQAVFETAGEYQLVVITPPTAAPVGDLDKDLSAVVSAGGDYKLTEMSVR